MADHEKDKKVIDVDDHKERSVLKEEEHPLEVLKVKRTKIISMNTVLIALEYISVIIENILVVLWYDSTEFKRSTIFWVMFGFAYLSTLDGFTYNVIAMVLFEIGQFVVYSWFCSFDRGSMIIFAVCLFIQIWCKLSAILVYKFSNIQSKLIHKHIHQTVKQYKFFSQAKWVNFMELLLLTTTVPMFYFNQS